jgi:hypothetical protein
MGFFAYPACRYPLLGPAALGWVPPSLVMDPPPRDLAVPPGPQPERFRFGGCNSWSMVGALMQTVLERDPLPVNLVDADWSNPCRDVDREPGIYAPWVCRRIAQGIDALLGITRRDAPDADIEAGLSEDDGRGALRWAAFLWRCEGFFLHG